MRALVTGAEGFIGKNLLLHLKEVNGLECVCFTRNNKIGELVELIEGVDWVFHLAGTNRPTTVGEFFTDNVALSLSLCDVIRKVKRPIPIVLASSIQVEQDNDYGMSKQSAEAAFLALQNDTGSPVFIYRLPNVFGKWARPNYNSVVATFCYNIARDLPIKIIDPSAIISLVYIDDVVESFTSLLSSGSKKHNCFVEVSPVYRVTVEDLADILCNFKRSRESLVIDSVGTGLTRALYSTYVSYLPVENFSYCLPQHRDERGVFVEMLKTKDSGQFSFFTLSSGVTRGGHYHHSKTEKFLVITGKAKFCFRHTVTGEFHELIISGSVSKIVETAPGWAHEVTNVGEQELICMLWANEIFDQKKPDTCPFVIGKEA